MVASAMNKVLIKRSSMIIIYSPDSNELQLKKEGKATTPQNKNEREN